MLKLLHTGDLHLGRGYQKQEQTDPALAKRYREARMEALENVVRLAEQERCDALVVAGDVFDAHTLQPALVKEVAELLGRCPCPVVVLPGNHDYCEGPEDKLWARFRECAGDNTLLLTEPKPVPVGETMVFYPCPCLDRYSQSNALGWVKADDRRDTDKVNIGVAHGAIEGLSFDREKRYYYMTRQELESTCMDLWLIGHTHMPYPEQETISGERIFNAGTHQQTDVADNSPGSAFLIEVADDKSVTARRVHTGVIQFVRKERTVRHGDSLEAVLAESGEGLDKASTTLRLTLSGVALEEDWQNRFSIYETAGKDYLHLEVLDGELQQEITREMIDRETLEGSLENRLLKQYMDEPELLNLAYGLVNECRKEG